MPNSLGSERKVTVREEGQSLRNGLERVCQALKTKTVSKINSRSQKHVAGDKHTSYQFH